MMISTTFPPLVSGIMSVRGSARPRIFVMTYKIPSDIVHPSIRANIDPKITHIVVCKIGIIIPRAIVGTKTSFFVHLLINLFIEWGMPNKLTIFSMIPKDINAATAVYKSITTTTPVPEVGTQSVNGFAIPNKLDTTYKNPFKKVVLSAKASKPPKIVARKIERIGKSMNINKHKKKILLNLDLRHETSTLPMFVSFLFS